MKSEYISDTNNAEFDAYHNAKLKTEIVEFLRHPDNRYHITIAPPVGHANEYVINRCNDLFKRLNRHVYSRQFSNRNGFIDGIVVYENLDKHNPHFHIIVRDADDALPEFDEFHALVEKIWPTVSGEIDICAETGEMLKTYPFFSSHSIKVQPYTNDGTNRLEKYLVKEAGLHRQSQIRFLECMAFLDVDGISFPKWTSFDRRKRNKIYPSALRDAIYNRDNLSAFELIKAAVRHYKLEDTWYCTVPAGGSLKRVIRQGGRMKASAERLSKLWYSKYHRDTYSGVERAIRIALDVKLRKAA